MKKKHTCKGCGGLCCENQHRPPFMLDEVEKLPKDLRREVKTYDYHEGHPCIWLTLDGTCKHYDLRPQICRNFKPGTKWCKRMQRWRSDWVERVRRQAPACLAAEKAAKDADYHIWAREQMIKVLCDNAAAEKAAKETNP